MNADPGTAQRDLVILIHGLGRSSIVFWRLKPFLRRAGLETMTYSYPSTRHGAATHIRNFRGWLKTLGNPPRRVHFVGHSLGSIVARGALIDPPPLDVGRLVMIGPPNQGAGFLKALGEKTWARWFFGPSMQDLEQGSPFIRDLGTPPIDIGVIAGASRFFALNPAAYVNHVFSPDVPHDGTVEVRNTRLDGMADFIVLPVNHTLLCQDREVMTQSLHFLRDGRFDHAGAAARGKVDPAYAKAG